MSRLLRGSRRTLRPLRGWRWTLTARGQTVCRRCASRHCWSSLHSWRRGTSSASRPTSSTTPAPSAASRAWPARRTPASTSLEGCTPSPCGGSSQTPATRRWFGGRCATSPGTSAPGGSRAERRTSSWTRPPRCRARHGRRSSSASCGRAGACASHWRLSAASAWRKPRPWPSGSSALWTTGPPLLAGASSRSTCGSRRTGR
mmetsp:Transcript_94578/g.251201  ORF Transcript_94578/g.251201 Transcript_94578/m.251201 type:complete len:202 (-) Transcript_94578:243-848(-)